MALDCDLETCSVFEVREWFSVHDPGKCCECHQPIPDGEKRAVIEIVSHFDGEWFHEIKPQHLECYRFMRKLRYVKGFCATLGSFQECLDNARSCEKDEWYFAGLEWDAIKNKIAKRLKKGEHPWDFEDGHPHAFIDDGQWQARISEAFQEEEAFEVPAGENIKRFEAEFGFAFVREVIE